MPTITFNGLSKTITIGYDGAITSLTAVEIYSAWKTWVLAGNAQYLPAFAESVGGNDIGGGASLGQYVFLLNASGWRITALSGHDYEIRIVGDLYPTDPDISMFTPVLGQTVLFTVQRSVGSTLVASDGGSLAPTAEEIADQVWADAPPIAVDAPTASEIADAVWDEEMDEHTTLGTYGDRARKEITRVRSAP